MKIYDGRFKEITIKEIACKCGCGFNQIADELIEIFMIIRRLFGKAIKITSGCRCVNHNKKIGGATNSRHLKGLALDIQVFNKPSNVADAILAFHELGFAVGVVRNNNSINIGINSNLQFYHIDIDYTGGRKKLLFRY